MPCFYPLHAGRDSAGKITFNDRSIVGFSMRLPCGQCRGCRLERSRQWAMRCVHEASLYDENCFITLTYSDEFLPSNGSLNVKHFQDFMKRLRAKVPERRIRYFHCGEYGDDWRRPHYHALLFNFDFADKLLFEVDSGVRLYTSALLEKCWGFGFGTVGAVTFESAAYTARYIMKKRASGSVDDAMHYLSCDEITGELVELLPEYATMSRRPGIGREWYERFRSDVFPSDEVVLRGRSMKPPRFYGCLYEGEEPEDYARIMSARRRAGYAGRADSTPKRLAVRERCQELSEARSSRRGDHEA